MQRLEKVRLPEVVLRSRIMSTLPVEYFEFQSVWESIRCEMRSVNLLTEWLRLIEARFPVKNGEESVFVIKTKKQNNFERQSNKKGDFDKMVFKCFKCHKPMHNAKQCKQKSHNKATNYLTKETGEAFTCELVEVSDSDVW